MKNPVTLMLSQLLAIFFTLSVITTQAQSSALHSESSCYEEFFMQRIDLLIKQYPQRFEAMNDQQINAFREKQLQDFRKKNIIREGIKSGTLEFDSGKTLLAGEKRKADRPRKNPVKQVLKHDNGSLIASIPESDSLALVALYNSTNGDDWYSNYNWLSGPVNTWYGVSTDDFTGEVTEIWLYSNNLVGSIPAEIGDFQTLYYLDLSGNNLSGTIPSEIGNLENLWYLDLSNNSLSGSIPVEIGNLFSLDYLYLGSNLLDGNLPVELIYLYVYHLDISWNNFSGEIPYDLCWTIYDQFDCAGNYFDSGSCPTISCMVDNCVYIWDGWQKNEFDLLQGCGVLPYVSIVPDYGYTCSAPFFYYFDAVVAGNYDYIYWYTSGDGYFDDAYGTNPTYYMGNQDILDGYVAISVEAGKYCEYTSYDYFTLYLNQVFVEAGNDMNPQVGQPVWITGSTASNYDQLRWESSGTGYFDNNQWLDPTYYPGVEDIVAGTVSLCLSAIIGDCEVTDCLQLNFYNTGSPDINANPVAFSPVLETGGSVAYQLELENTGTGFLAYEIDLVSSGGPLKSQRSVEEILRQNQTLRNTFSTASPGGIKTDQNANIPIMMSAKEIMLKRSKTKSSVTPKIACVVDSYGSHYSLEFWDNLNATFSDIIIDYSTLSIPNITHNDLVNSGADVLIIDDAWNPLQVYGELTMDEIDAIEQFVNEGKGLIVTSGTLNDYLVPNHSNLAPLLGLDPNAFYEWNNGSAYVGGFFSHFDINNPVHPVFNRISNPYIPGYPASSVPETKNWLDAVVEAEIIAIAQNNEAVITSYKNRVFISTLPSVWAGTNDYRLMYNSIRFCAIQPSWMSISALSGVVESDMPESRAIEYLTVFFDAGDLPVGEYYATISITSNDPDESPIDLPVVLTVTEGGIPEILNLDYTTTFAGNTCHAALQTIVVGGNWFVVEGNAIMSLEAGNNIVMLPGTYFKEGSTVRAHIVTDGAYCILPTVAEAENDTPQTTEKNMSTLLKEQSSGSDPLIVSIYPNPTTGLAIIELSEPATGSLIEVYNLMGNLVMRRELPGELRFNLDLGQQPKGIYIIRALNGKTSESLRLIKH